MSQVFAIRPARADDRPAVEKVIFAVLTEYGLVPDPGGIDADLRQIPEYYEARGGSFDVLLSADGEIAGSVALWPIDDQRVELRKMYFAATARGRGLGKAVLDRAVRRTRAQGYVEMQLETASVLKEAIGLYRSVGFVETADGPDTCRCDVKMRLRLADYRSRAGLPVLEDLAAMPG